MNYIDHIKRIRTEKGYSQEYVAKQLGIATNNYSLLERGSTALTVDRLIKLSEIFETPLSTFFENGIKPERDNILLEFFRVSYGDFQTYDSYLLNIYNLCLVRATTLRNTLKDLLSDKESLIQYHIKRGSKPANEIKRDISNFIGIVESWRDIQPDQLTAYCSFYLLENRDTDKLLQALRKDFINSVFNDPLFIELQKEEILSNIDLTEICHVFLSLDVESIIGNIYQEMINDAKVLKSNKKK